MDIDDFEEWNGKYNIGDMFVDSFGSDDIVSYIYRIEYEPNSRITYYWLRYCCDDERNNYFTEEELDRNLEDLSCFKHYPVKK
jgi:hypothetical protein